MAGGYFLLFFLASTANKEKYLDNNAGSSEVSKDVCTESGSKELLSCSSSSNVLTAQLVDTTIFLVDKEVNLKLQ